MIDRVVGNYRIVEKVGEGGMGAVYRAVDLMLEREVAIKAIRPELAREPEIVERFRAEARMLARVSHPAIATIYSFFADGEDLFLAMEFVRGQQLSRVLQAGPLPWEQAVPLLAVALEGIEQAHRAGIVHRDLKADNLMIGEGGTVKVMDFGIARLVGSGRLTRTGLLIGTLRYMAPEQIQGTEVDRRTDVYALGTVLYEMVTGRVPFDGGSDYAVLKAQVEEQPTPPSSARPELPGWLDQAILRALAKSPWQRFQTVDEMRLFLLRGLGVPATALPGLPATGAMPLPGLPARPATGAEPSSTLPIGEQPTLAKAPTPSALRLAQLTPAAGVAAALPEAWQALAARPPDGPRLDVQPSDGTRFEGQPSDGTHEVHPPMSGAPAPAPAPPPAAPVAAATPSRGHGRFVLMAAALLAAAVLAAAVLAGILWLHGRGAGQGGAAGTGAAQQPGSTTAANPSLVPAGATLPGTVGGGGASGSPESQLPSTSAASGIAPPANGTPGLGGATATTATTGAVGAAGAFETTPAESTTQARLRAARQRRGLSRQGSEAGDGAAAGGSTNGPGSAETSPATGASAATTTVAGGAAGGDSGAGAGGHPAGVAGGAGDMPIGELARLGADLDQGSRAARLAFAEFLAQKVRSSAPYTSADDQLKEGLKEFQISAERFHAQFQTGFFARARVRVGRLSHGEDERGQITRLARALVESGARVEAAIAEVKPDGGTRLSWRRLHHEYQRVAELCGL